VDIAIRAVGSIRNQVPELELHIYGSGPEKQSLEALVRDLGLADKVFLRSARPIREIAEIMCEADLGVVPKRSDSFGDEAFSTKILEFMAVGIPVVLSSTTVDRYYFNDSVVKFFPSGNEQALAQVILELAEHPEVRGSLVANGFSFVRTRDWESTRGEYLALVDTITGRDHLTNPRAASIL
jgi:glycosyltransferase involved in cell wall biosynthesis